ncbi:hypothetical protein [Haloglomus litoreum]|uniref:hypothetical protein n=1 Tax=Haloglomus litoreum TaxID=3034026 RepID=UPI0023E7F478|nr:hypothetical protein [Haloglomus sp. DT116]
MDKQVATLESIDDKAMRTVRTAIIVLGFVASTAGIAGPSELGGIPLTTQVFLFFGVAFLLIAAFVGIGTYTVTEYPVGVRDDFRDRALRRSREKWVESLLGKYDEWTAELEDEITTNGGYLEDAQFALLIGIFCLVFAAGLVVLKQSYGVEPLQATGAVFLSVLTGLLLFALKSRW